MRLGAPDTSIPLRRILIPPPAVPVPLFTSLSRGTQGCRRTVVVLDSGGHPRCQRSGVPGRGDLVASNGRRLPLGLGLRAFLQAVGHPIIIFVHPNCPA